MAAATSGSAVEEPRPRPPAGESPLVEELGSGEATAWDAHVRTHQDATLYHLYAWRRVARRAYDLEAPFLVARDAPGGVIRGVLPLFLVPRPFAPYLTNGLFGAYGDVLADDPRYARALVRAAVDRVGRGADYLHLKLLRDQYSELEQRDIWVMARLTLGADEGSTWQGLPSAMRNKIRHAENSGLVVGPPGDLDGFYEVLAENMLRKGAPIYGRTFFRVLTEELGADAGVVTLRHEGRVVSGAFVAAHNGVLYVPFSSSRVSVFPLKANQLLWWHIVRHAHAKGATTLDFGSSVRGSSGLEFKKHWRARVEPVRSGVHARAGVSPVLLPSQSVVAKLSVRSWGRLPPTWAEVLGPKVARWIA